MMMNKQPPFAWYVSDDSGFQGSGMPRRRVQLRKGNSVDISLSNHTGLFDIYAVFIAQLK